MGEYAKRKSDGEEIRIGTCEDMYYLRHDQAGMVSPLSNSLDPVAEAGVLRFRFPWPEEDGNAPGEFEGAFKGQVIEGMAPPLDVNHYGVQFSSHHGLIVNLPCPFGGKWPEGLNYMRNGFQGAVLLVAQRKIEDHLWAVCRCGGCGSMWRLCAMEGEALAVRLRAMADNLPSVCYTERERLQVVADRVLAGYGLTIQVPA